MFKSIKFNFQSDQGFARKNWLCLCRKIDSQNHVERCVLYSDLRESLNLSDIDDLISYFDAVLKRREEDEEEDLNDDDVSNSEDEDEDNVNI